MELNKEQKELLGKAILTYGHDNQQDMVIEECSELIQAILKKRRKANLENLQNLIEETADVFIMINQMILMVGEANVDTIVQLKLLRLQKNLNN
jgi:NTP pyrophosphatase (non-canonical NTP hydrolase)